MSDGTSYVRFHLFPIYVMPDLLAGLSTELRKRMQGKSCFNFKIIEPDLASELQDLVQRAEPRFKAELRDRKSRKRKR